MHPVSFSGLDKTKVASSPSGSTGFVVGKWRKYYDGYPRARNNDQSFVSLSEQLSFDRMNNPYFVRWRLFGYGHRGLPSCHAVSTSETLVATEWCIVLMNGALVTQRSLSVAKWIQSAVEGMVAAPSSGSETKYGCSGYGSMHRNCKYCHHSWTFSGIRATVENGAMFRWVKALKRGFSYSRTKNVRTWRVIKRSNPIPVFTNND